MIKYYIIIQRRNSATKNSKFIFGRYNLNYKKCLHRTDSIFIAITGRPLCIVGENNFHCSSDRMGFIVDRVQLARELDVWIYRHERNKRSFIRRETEITKNIEEPEIVDLKIELRTINFQGIVKIFVRKKGTKKF